MTMMYWKSVKEPEEIEALKNKKDYSSGVIQGIADEAYDPSSLVVHKMDITRTVIMYNGNIIKYLLTIFMSFAFLSYSQQKRVTDGSFYLQDLAEDDSIRGELSGYDKHDTLLFFSRIIPDSYYQQNNIEAEIKDGEFKLNNSFDYPQLFYTLLASDKGKMSVRHKIFFLDRYTRNIHIDYTDWKESVGDGKTAEEYETLFKPLALESLELPDEETFSSLLHQHSNELDSFLFRYAEDHPQSFLPLWFVAQRFHLLGYNELREQTLFLLDEKVKRSEVWTKLSKDLKNAAIKRGAEFPKFEVEDMQGEKTVFSLPKAKIILVDFWFSFCKPCIASIPELKKLYEVYEPYGFEIIGVSRDSESTRKKWLDMITDRRMSWKQYLDKNGEKMEKMQIHLFPRYLLLDEKGEILDPDISISKVEEVLKEKLL